MTDAVTAGVDGSRESVAAALRAAGEARANGCRLHLVHVAAEAGPFADEDAVRAYGERVVQEVTGEVGQQFPELAVHSAVMTGRAATVLTGLSDTSVLLVLGSRGLSTLHGFLVGSVALATVAHARCPVVLVRGPASAGAEAGAAGGPPPAVVVGVDTLFPCEELLAFAFATARLHGQPLRIVHGWEPPLQYGSWPVPLTPATTERYLQGRAADLAAMVRPWREQYRGVRVEERVVFEQPARLLVQESEGAALTVVGRRRHRRPGEGSYVGPVAHAVMHHVRTPVAVVPHA